MLLSSKRKTELAEFCNRIDLKVSNYELLNSAFCHTSYTYENKLDRLISYERLEFLGDAVLKLVVSDMLYEKYPDKQEGKLTEQRAIAISDKTIAAFAEKLNMDKLILTGKCEGDFGKKKESLLACSFEALLGVIFLENKEKGYNVAREFLAANFKKEITNIIYINPKAELQELTQKYNHNLPRYAVLEEKGPSHDRTFVVGVYYENEFLDSAEASSKKEAEMLAAKKALEKLKKVFEGETT